MMPYLDKKKYIYACSVLYLKLKIHTCILAYHGKKGKKLNNYCIVYHKV